MQPPFFTPTTVPFDREEQPAREQEPSLVERADKGRWLRILAVYLVGVITLQFPGAILAEPPGEPSILRQHAMRAGDSNARSRTEGGSTMATHPTLTSDVIAANGISLPVRGTADVSAWSSPQPTVGIHESQSGSHQRVPVALATKSIELKPPRGSELSKPHSTGARSGSISSMLLALGFVVGLFLVANQVVRKAQPKRFLRLPDEVVEVLGRSSMGQRQQLVVLRFGSKLILVSQQAGETQTLAEITEPTEVERLQALCLGRVEPISSEKKKESVFHSMYKSLT